MHCIIHNVASASIPKRRIILPHWKCARLRRTTSTATYRMKCVILAANANEYGSVYYILNFIRVLYTTNDCFFLCLRDSAESVCYVYLSWSKRVLFHLIFIVYRDFFSICSVNCIWFVFFCESRSRMSNSIVDGPKLKKQKTRAIFPENWGF